MTEATPTFWRHTDGDAAHASGIRAALVAHLRAQGVSPDACARVAAASAEALANVAEHAYPDGRGRVEIVADVTPGDVQVVVRDEGRGLTPDQAHGLGLGIIAHEADEFELRERPHGGIEVWMRFGA